METKTIKLINHNFQAVFYLQINGEVAERLIAEGKESEAWGRLYADLHKLFSQDPQNNCKNLLRFPLFMVLRNKDAGGECKWLNDLYTHLLNSAYVIDPSEGGVFLSNVIEEIVT